MPREDSKRFIPGYYLPENYVKGLFEKANSHKKVNKTFGDAQIIEAISKLDEINKVSIFFGDSKGNSIIRQCIAFKNDKLLEYFLKMKPLAAFVRHAREERRAVFAGAEGGEEEDGDDDDDDDDNESDEYDEEDDEDESGEEEEDDGYEVKMEDDHIGEDEEKIEDNEIGSVNGSERSLNEQDVGDEGERSRRSTGRSPKNAERKSTRKSPKNVDDVNANPRKKNHSDTINCYEFAMKKKNYNAIKIMHETSSKALVEQFGFLPEPFTGMIKRLMYYDYHELVCSIIKSMPLAVQDNGDDFVIISMPLSDLGTLQLLRDMVEKVDTTVFDSDIMGLVVEKLWLNHIRRRFLREFGLLVVFFGMWMQQCSNYSDKKSNWKNSDNWTSLAMSLCILLINTYFAGKEGRQAKKTAETSDDSWLFEDEAIGGLYMVGGILHDGIMGIEVDGEVDESLRNQRRLPEGGKSTLLPKLVNQTLRKVTATGMMMKKGRKRKEKPSIRQILRSYLSDMYNVFDLLNVLLIYFTVLIMRFDVVEKETEVIAASMASFTLTFKSIGYLRGFGETGWLVKVLNQNFSDMRHFLIIIGIWILGFAVVFRLTLSDLPSGECGLEAVNATSALPTEYSCDPHPYANLWISYVNVFSMSILGDFDTGLFYNVNHTMISFVMFLIMQVGLAVVCLNALIALLGDSYGDIQQNQHANIRRERAKLIVEHLIVMSKKDRKAIAEKSRTLYKKITKKEYQMSQGKRLFSSDR